MTYRNDDERRERVKELNATTPALLRDVAAVKASAFRREQAEIAVAERQPVEVQPDGAMTDEQLEACRRDIDVLLNSARRG